MRRFFSIPVAGLLMTACAAPPPSTGPTSERAPVESRASAYRALSAYIVPPEQGGLRFHVNRPAYVAMFEIVPNGGTRLIYPTPGSARMDGFVFSGARVGGGGYWDGGEMPYGGVYSHAGSMTRPRFIFLIASERPLDIDAFGSYGTRMRSVLGNHYYASSSPQATIERIAEVALPSMVDDGTWTTDLYVYWPQALRQYRASRDVLIRCNGYTAFVAYEYAYQARRYLCGQPYGQVAVRPGSPTPPPPPADDGDSTAIERPARRAPLPADGEATQRKLGSSRQLQQPPTERPRERTAVAEEISSEPSEPAAEPGSGRRPDAPVGRARPESPRSVPAAPAPRAARPVPTEAPPAPRAEPEDRLRPRPVGGAERTPAARPSGGAQPRESTPRARPSSEGAQPRAVPREAAPRKATPQQARPPRSTPRSQPAARPSGGQSSEAPAKRGGGGGGDGGQIDGEDRR